MSPDEQPPQQLVQEAILRSESSILKWVQAEKAKDRKELAKLPPELAQCLAESILDPKNGRVVDERQLRWPGDLADPWDEPYE